MWTRPHSASGRPGMSLPSGTSSTRSALAQLARIPTIYGLSVCRKWAEQLVSTSAGTVKAATDKLKRVGSIAGRLSCQHDCCRRGSKRDPKAAYCVMQSSVQLAADLIVVAPCIGDDDVLAVVLCRAFKLWQDLDCQDVVSALALRFAAGAAILN